MWGGRRSDARFCVASPPFAVSLRDREGVAALGDHPLDHRRGLGCVVQIGGKEIDLTPMGRDLSIGLADLLRRGQAVHHHIGAHRRKGRRDALANAAGRWG